MSKLRAHATFYLASKDGSSKLPLSLFSLGIGVGASSLPSLFTWCQNVGILALSQLFSLAPREEVKGRLPFPYRRRKFPRFRPKVVKRAMASQLMMMMMMMMMMTIKGDFIL